MPTATVELENTDDGRRVRDAATGDGPVDAIFRAMERLTGVSLKLADYQIRSVTGGKEAQGEVRLEALHGERTVAGRGVSTDILEASAKAYLSAINRTLSRRGPKKRRVGVNRRERKGRRGRQG
jgi:2-isopropylmalate synthase